MSENCPKANISLNLKCLFSMAAHIVLFYVHLLLIILFNQISTLILPIIKSIKYKLFGGINVCRETLLLLSRHYLEKCFKN